MNDLVKVRADHALVVDSKGKLKKASIEAGYSVFEEKAREVLGWTDNFGYDTMFDKLWDSDSASFDKVIVNMYHNGYGVD